MHWPYSLNIFRAFDVQKFITQLFLSAQKNVVTYKMTINHYFERFYYVKFNPKRPNIISCNNFLTQCLFDDIQKLLFNHLSFFVLHIFQSKVLFYWFSFWAFTHFSNDIDDFLTHTYFYLIFLWYLATVIAF